MPHAASNGPWAVKPWVSSPARLALRLRGCVGCLLRHVEVGSTAHHTSRGLGEHTIYEPLVARGLFGTWPLETKQHTRACANSTDYCNLHSPPSTGLLAADVPTLTLTRAIRCTLHALHDCTAVASAKLCATQPTPRLGRDRPPPHPASHSTHGARTAAHNPRTARDQPICVPLSAVLCVGRRLVAMT